MKETYSTVLENGREYAEELAEDFRRKGYKVSEVQGPKRVFRGDNHYVMGYQFEVDDGRPTGSIFDKYGYH